MGFDSVICREDVGRLTFVDGDEDVAVGCEGYAGDVLPVLEWERAGFVAEHVLSAEWDLGASAKDGEASKQRGRAASHEADLVQECLNHTHTQVESVVCVSESVKTHLTRSKTDTLLPTGESTEFPSGVKTTLPCR